MNDLSEQRLSESAKIVKGLKTYHGNDLPGYVLEQTGGRGLDVAVVACPSPEVQAAMLPLMEYGGRIIFFGGVPASKQPVAIDTNLIHYKELFITGSTRANICHFRKTLEFIAEGLVDVKSLVTARFGIDDILTAFENAKRAEGLKNVIVF
jgi:L-iditol 2-dehydrogenase